MQIDANALASYRSHFVRANELQTIHHINDETFEAASLVPKATLEAWWRANPLSIRLVSTIDGEVVGYWHILPLLPRAYRGITKTRLSEREIDSTDVLTYQALKPGAVYIYITAVSALNSAGSAAVILDMFAFFQLLYKQVGINGIAAQAVSDAPLNLIASLGMLKVTSASRISTWILESQDQISRAMQIAQQQLKRLKGLVPEVPRDEWHSLMALLRR